VRQTLGAIVLRENINGCKHPERQKMTNDTKCREQAEQLKREYLKQCDLEQRQPRGKKCRHKQWVEFFPKEAFIHRKKMDKDKTYKIESIKIRICFDCYKTLDIKDYHE
jgi:hypothetical protein